MKLLGILATLSIWELVQRGWDVLYRDYQWFILRPLQVDLLARSMEASILIGIVSGVVGSLVVVRGMSFFADALAHTILPGVAYTYQRSRSVDDNSLFWGGMIAGLISAITIGLLTRNERLRSDTAIGVVFAAMFALGVAMVSRVDSYAGDLSHILFGQILGVSQQDLQNTLIFSVIVLATVILFYKEFLVVSFDPILAKTMRLPTEFFRFLLLVLMAITIVVSLQIVGIALMLALLVTPAATASLMTKRLHSMMILAALIGAASSIIGFYISFHLEIATGPSIVLTATGLFVFILIKQIVAQYGLFAFQRIRFVLSQPVTQSPESTN
jgi:manganese/iron transport system permease protein